MRILALTLIAACSYSEPVGSSLLTTDAGETTDSGGSDPRVLTETEQCSFTQYGADLYCLNAGAVQTATDGRVSVAIRRVTPDLEFVDEATMSSPLVYGFATGDQVQDADRIYFGAELRPQTQYDDGDWAIYAYDKHTHAFAVVVDGLDEGPRHLFVADGSLYFMEYDHVPPNTAHQYDRLYQLPVTGGTPTLLTDQLDAAEQLVTDGTFVYVSDLGRYTVNAIAIAPPHRVLTLATTGTPYDSAAPPPFKLLVHGPWLYYSTQGQPAGSIHRVPRPSAHATQDDVSAVDEVVAAGPGMVEATSMVAKDDMLYWTEYLAGLQRAPLDGSAPPETLVSLGRRGNGYAVIVGEWVYFSTPRADNTGNVIAQYHITP